MILIGIPRADIGPIFFSVGEDPNLFHRRGPEFSHRRGPRLFPAGKDQNHPTGEDPDFFQEERARIFPQEKTHTFPSWRGPRLLLQVRDSSTSPKLPDLECEPRWLRSSDSHATASYGHESMRTVQTIPVGKSHPL